MNLGQIMVSIVVAGVLALTAWAFVDFYTLSKPRKPKVPEPSGLDVLNPRIGQSGGAFNMPTFDAWDKCKCPDCGGKFFYPGPEGGMAVNIKCANKACGTKWWFAPPFTPKRIDNDDKFYNLAVARRLGDM